MSDASSLVTALLEPPAFLPPAPPALDGVGAALNRDGQAPTANGVMYRPCPDTRADEPAGGELYTKAETRRILLAADAYQRALEALQRAEDALSLAKVALMKARPDPVPVDERLAQAEARVDGQPVPEPKQKGKPAAQLESERARARRSIEDAELVIAARVPVVEAARGALRVAIIDAAKAARARAAARWCELGLLVHEVAGEMAGLDMLLGHFTGATALDTFGIWRRCSQLVAPPVEMRPKGTKVEQYNVRELIFLADGLVHDARTRSAQFRAEQALRKLLADAVPWPF